jgi:2,4-dienoyl-CoA reductase-like NADH-dependent reductase (Old Yellow Enzyme family)
MNHVVEKAVSQIEKTTDKEQIEQNQAPASLFLPLTLRSVTLRNRIGVSPMCQYISVDGFANDWHLVHLGSRAIGGAGIVFVEASAVEARGRITADDLGIYKDEHIEELSSIAQFIERFGAVPAMQIAHAGRKASTKNPWKIGNRHDKQDLTDAEGGWDIVGPSAVPFSEAARVPHELTVSEIKEIEQKFVAAAKRVLTAGFKCLEIHAAHGYLLHSFYSPLSNFRTDEYGGAFDNRVRMLLETVEAVRAVWPEHLPLSVRISASDWVEGGWSVDDSVRVAKLLKERGVDIVDCSSGYIRAQDRYKQGPGWQVPLADKVRNEANIPTATVGGITDPHQADAIIKEGKADLVLLAREEMRDPYWPFHAAQALGVKDAPTLPKNYTYAI